MARSLGRHRHSFFATVALLTFAVAPLALAQSATKAKKKGAQPAASASASASAAAPDEPTPSATPAAPPPESAPPDVPAAGASVPDTEVADDMTNTLEAPSKTYRFIGLRYRGTIIPSFLEHLFVNDGGTVYSNTFGAEMDFRKDGKSTIVWLQYTEYGFGNTLFFQKGQPDEANNYSIVNSSLKGIYAGLDELWSTPVANHVDFEYGFGLGLGVIFGNLYNDWVFGADPTVTAGTPGAIQGSNGQYYAPCNSTNDGPLLKQGTGANQVTLPYSSCSPQAHSNASVAKVANYVEPNWFNGGAVPVIFPHVAGQLGFRYKPIKQMEARFSLGISLTGFWFGISADYGLEETHSDTHPASKPPSKEPPADSSSSDKSSREIGYRETL
jgi:hypothetical protein